MLIFGPHFTVKNYPILIIIYNYPIITCKNYPILTIVYCKKLSY